MSGEVTSGVPFLIAGTAGLAYSLVAAVALYVLVLFRNSSGQPWWPTVTTVAVVLLWKAMGSFPFLRSYRLRPQFQSEHPPSLAL